MIGLINLTMRWTALPNAPTIPARVEVLSRPGGSGGSERNTNRGIRISLHVFGLVITKHLADHVNVILHDTSYSMSLYRPHVH